MKTLLDKKKWQWHITVAMHEFIPFIRVSIYGVRLGNFSATSRREQVTFQ
jgi:hypothetical protein